ncbi:carboxymuconolactone decarboxylase family protein [Terrabacter sp. GCM10028922]|uniref:carboxymuconolactone decarboxylase family protein n=1 Tax=Terrabacter sp. GCM10028922 TaxID=3273428 RepID=UPI0036205040
MRLEILEHGHKLPARLFIRLSELLFRQPMDNVALTAMHRPDFWGRPFFAVGTQVLRGPSYWTVGEREYMAMLVSRLNDCPFCARVHTETTRIEARGEVSIDDPSVRRPELAAVIPLLEKLTKDPESCGPADIDAARDAGVPDEAIIDALHVGFLFNTVNRMANAFDWTWESEGHVRVAAKVIHRIRYRLPGFILR